MITVKKTCWFSSCFKKKVFLKKKNCLGRKVSCMMKKKTNNYPHWHHKFCCSLMTGGQQGPWQCCVWSDGAVRRCITWQKPWRRVHLSLRKWTGLAAMTTCSNTLHSTLWQVGWGLISVLSMLQSVLPLFICLSFSFLPILSSLLFPLSFSLLSVLIFLPFFTQSSFSVLLSHNPTFSAHVPSLLCPVIRWVKKDSYVRCLMYHIVLN